MEILQRLIATVRERRARIPVSLALWAEHITRHRYAFLGAHLPGALPGSLPATDLVLLDERGEPLADGIPAVSRWLSRPDYLRVIVVYDPLPIVRAAKLTVPPVARQLLGFRMEGIRQACAAAGVPTARLADAQAACACW